MKRSMFRFDSEKMLRHDEQYLAELRKAARQTDIKAMNNLAWYYYNLAVKGGTPAEQKRQILAAEAVLKKAIMLDDNEFLIYANLGEVCFQLQKFTDAVVYYARANELQKDNIIVLNNLASAYFKQKDYTNALKCMRRVVAAVGRPDLRCGRSRPHCGERDVIYYNYALTLLKMKKISRCQKYTDFLFREYEKGTFPIEAVDAIDIAGLYYLLGEYEKTTYIFPKNGYEMYPSDAGMYFYSCICCGKDLEGACGWLFALLEEDEKEIKENSDIDRENKEILLRAKECKIREIKDLYCRIRKGEPYQREIFLKSLDNMFLFA